MDARLLLVFCFTTVTVISRWPASEGLFQLPPRSHHPTLLSLQSNNNNNDDSSSPHHHRSILSNFTDVHKQLRLPKAQTQIDPILAAPDAPFVVETEMAKRVTSVYAKAAVHRRQLDALHLDDAGAVLQVHSGYYKALSAKGYDLMQQLWLPDASVTCIHPFVEPIVGYNYVMASWQQVWPNPDD